MSCAKYSGGYCSSLVNYTVYLPPSQSFESTEAGMKANSMDLLLSLKSNSALAPCIDAFLEWICYSSYPMCSSTSIGTATQMPIVLPCSSVCKSMAEQCATLFNSVGKGSSLPDCSGQISSSFNATYAVGPPCLGQAVSTNPTPSNTPNTSNNASIAPATNSTTAKCPSFLLPNPSNSSETDNTQLMTAKKCTGGCCLPCPVLYSFYPSNEYFSVHNRNALMLNALSLAATFVLLLFYPVDKKRNEYPGCFVYQFLIGAFAKHGNTCMSFSGSSSARASLTCLDGITMATQDNSGLCAFQGLVSVFVSYFISLWVLAFSVALNAALVHARTSLSVSSQRMLAGAIVAVGAAGAVAAYLEKGLASASWSGCVYSANATSLGLLIYPTGVFMILSALVNLWTLAHVISIKLKVLEQVKGTGSARHDSTGPSTEEGTAGAGPGPGAGAGRSKSIVTANHSARILLGGQTAWGNGAQSMRFILQDTKPVFAICLFYTLVLVTSWVLTFSSAIVFLMTESSSQPPEWTLNWYMCILKGGSQQQCFGYAAANVPPAVTFVIADYMEASMGTIAFIFLIKRKLEVVGFKFGKKLNSK